MATRFFTPTGLLLAIALVSLGCGDDEPQTSAIDAGVTADAGPPPDPACGDDCDPPPGDAGHSPSSAGSCCETQSTTGCEDPSVEACVCAIDRLCCAGAWDERCVELVEAEGCGLCGPEPSRACEPSQVVAAAPSTLSGVLGEGPQIADAVELSCGSIAEPEIVFGFVAPEAGTYTFSTEGSAIFDTVLAVLDSGACDGAELDCNDDDGLELSARVVVDLQADQEVLVVVESWGEESGEVEVSITAGGAVGSVSAAELERCEPSELLAELPASVTGEASAEQDLLTPSCAPFATAGEVFYRFTAEQAGHYRFDTRGSDTDTLVQVLDADCAGEELACNDDSDLGGLAAIADLELAAGQSVIVSVDTFDGLGTYTLTVDRFDPSLQTPVESDGSCCTAQLTAGCGDAEVSACVCAVDDYCCTEAWDELCIDAVAILECGGC